MSPCSDGASVVCGGAVHQEAGRGQAAKTQEEPNGDSRKVGAPADCPSLYRGSWYNLVWSGPACRGICLRAVRALRMFIDGLFVCTLRVGRGRPSKGGTARGPPLTTSLLVAPCASFLLYFCCLHAFLARCWWVSPGHARPARPADVERVAGRSAGRWASGSHTCGQPSRSSRPVDLGWLQHAGLAISVHGCEHSAGLAVARS